MLSHPRCQAPGNFQVARHQIFSYTVDGLTRWLVYSLTGEHKNTSMKIQMALLAIWEIAITEFITREFHTH